MKGPAWPPPAGLQPVRQSPLRGLQTKLAHGRAKRRNSIRAKPIGYKVFDHVHGCSLEECWRSGPRHLIWARQRSFRKKQGGSCAVLSDSRSQSHHLPVLIRWTSPPTQCSIHIVDTMSTKCLLRRNSLSTRKLGNSQRFIVAAHPYNSILVAERERVQARRDHLAADESQAQATLALDTFWEIIAQLADASWRHRPCSHQSPSRSEWRRSRRNSVWQSSNGSRAAFIWLASHNRGRQTGLKKGQIILTGSCTGMYFVAPDAQVCGGVAGLGEVSVTFSTSLRLKRQGDQAQSETPPAAWPLFIDPLQLVAALGIPFAKPPPTTCAALLRSPANSCLEGFGTEAYPTRPLQAEPSPLRRRRAARLCLRPTASPPAYRQC